MTQDAEFLDTQSALGLLINLSGKMRMLSHRITMFILMRRLSADGASVAAKTGGSDKSERHLDAALEEFQLIFGAISKGSKPLRIHARVAEMLRTHGAVDDETLSAIETFLKRVDLFRKGQANEWVDDFVEFVAGKLLGCLNRITENITMILSEINHGQQESVQKNEAVVSEMLTSLEKVSLSIRLIALNASVEAVHAGDAGRGFSVIAQEIRSLSDRASNLVKDVRLHLA